MELLTGLLGQTSYVSSLLSLERWNLISGLSAYGIFVASQPDSDSSWET